jgi:hypothetical protein
MNNELKLLNKNLTDAKSDLENARVAFNTTDSDVAYDSMMACHKEISRIQGLIIDYLLTNK